jgi:biopolymer transport protein ExbB
MKDILTKISLLALLLLGWSAGIMAQTESAAEDSLMRADSVAASQLQAASEMADTAAIVPAESAGFHKALKRKFIEGNAGFMSLVALALVLGLAFCIERIIYLTLSEINAKRFMADVEKKLDAGDTEGAKHLCRDTRGPVASICYQGILHQDESMEEIERNIV